MSATPAVRSCTCTMVHQYNETKEFLAPVFEGIRVIAEETYEQRLLLVEIISDPIELICETNEDEMLALLDKLNAAKELHQYALIRLAMCVKHFFDNDPTLAITETSVGHNPMCTIDALRDLRADLRQLLAQNREEHLATVGLIAQIEELFAEHSSDALEAREEAQRMRIHVL